MIQILLYHAWICSHEIKTNQLLSDKYFRAVNVCRLYTVEQQSIGNCAQIDRDLQEWTGNKRTTENKLDD